MIRLRINGKPIIAEEGKTIYEIAKENDIEIPTLYGAESKNNVGDLCFVNVVGYEGLVDAFKTKAQNGMLVYTDSRSVKSARKLFLELILSDHYADCYEPCKVACPLNVEIQTVLSLIRNNLFDEAFKVLKKDLPMPITICTMCEGFCEKSCRRTLLDRNVRIKKVIDFIANQAFENKLETITNNKKKNGKKIAIVGGGVSGLSCAYFLSQKGYQIDIYEKESKAGGVLEQVLPYFIVNKDFVKFEIDSLLESVSNFIPNTEVGKDIDLGEIVNKYEAVYIASGLQYFEKPKIVNLANTKNVMDGIEFLKDFHNEKSIKLGKTNIVYGNGKIAINCARAVRHLDYDVNLYLTDNSLKYDKELKSAEEEGVNVIFNQKILKLKKEKNKLRKITVKNLLTNGSGDRKADFLILAFEPTANYEFIKKYSGKRIRFNTDGSLRIAKNLYTGISNIFVGGSLRLGKNQSVITTVLDGKIAANSIDKFIEGSLSRHTLDYNFYSVSELNPQKISPDFYKFFDKIPPVENEEESVKPKKFTPIEIGFDKNEAVDESKLCLECACRINESCKIKDYANQYHINPEYFNGEKNKFPIDNRHPFIGFDANKCILCGKCIEVCRPISGALSYSGKGFKLSVKPILGKALYDNDCLACGKCIEVCPTSAFYEKNINYSINTYSTKEYELNCGLCGLGCEIKATVQKGKVLKINPSGKGFNKDNLCFEGKFGWQVFEQENRIKHPMVRLDKANDWKEDKQEWEKIDLRKLAKDIKKKLKDLKERAIFVDPTVTIEEVLLLKTIAKEIGANIYSFHSEKKIMKKFYNTIYTEKKYSDLEKADVLVLIGEIPLVMKLKIRDLKKQGKKIIVVNQTGNAQDEFADIVLDSFSINNTLEKIIEYNNLDCDCSEDDCNCNKDEILAIDLPPKTMFVYNKHRVSERTVANILRLSYQICSEYKEGSGIFELSDFVNTKGFIRLDIKKFNLKIFDFVLLYGAMPNSEQLKWLEKSKLVISIDTHLDDDNIADIFIPKPDYLSIDGIALADGSKIVNFKNIKNEDFFENILKIFKEAGFINKEMSKPSYWNEKAKILVNNLPKPISYEENYLAELIESIEVVEEKINRFYPVYYFQINKLKKLN